MSEAPQGSTIQVESAPASPKHPIWMPVASWFVAILCFVNGGVAVSQPGYRAMALMFWVPGLLILPPVVGVIRKALPPYRPFWVPPLAALLAIMTTGPVVSSNDGPVGEAAQAPSSRQAADRQMAEYDQKVVAAPSEPARSNMDGPSTYAAFAEHMVGQKLKDPKSAQYGKITAYKTGNSLVVCGTVNAKNGFGAYMGPEPFIISDLGVAMGELEPEVIEAMCKGENQVTYGR